MESASGISSGTPVLESTETDVAHVNHGPTPVKDEQWRAMKAIIDTLYNHREPDGHDPSKVFHRKVNKRVLPDYYDVIKEPIALSTLKAKLNNREYTSFAGFVRDCALIAHNAQTYNRPEAQAYQDALVIKNLVELEFKKLADLKIIEPEVAVLPDLGEIPPVDPQPIEIQEEEEDEEDDDDEDDEADESDEEEGGKRKRKRGPRPSISVLKREGGSKEDIGLKSNDLGIKKKRGRPPRVDTPMEARIKAVLKGIRKPKNDLGQIMIHHFERLPDKGTMPEYFAEVKEPIAIELIKRKQKRKKYQSVDHFMRDIDTMFGNAKSYNEDDSQVHKDAVYLQREAHRLAEQEKNKPDTDFVMEEGRLPLPNGILHNGELWKVGDWIHIQNANDVTKPIVAQIYRTWQDNEGQKWVNACWYYRPEQTVHQYEKHFYPNEVVKTGQYRDHNVEEIIDRCFVMFFTRYSRGRPRGLPVDKDVYVCEARYNEEKHKLNKIKTWASCLPDEVRDKDYEMDLFDGLRKEKKVPSPLLHMLKEDAKETDEVPKPRWGIDNAPPIVGAVHKGPRDENQSPPPEPTPSPPPQPPPPPVRQISNISNQDQPTYRKQSDLSAAMEAAGQAFGSTPTPTHPPQVQPSFPAQAIQQYHQHSVSPAPLQHQNTQASTSYTPQPQLNTFVPPPQPARVDHYPTPQTRYPHQQTSNRTTTLPGIDANGPKPYEVYSLSDTANASIPDDIRSQFHHDERGRVLFFTSPPLDILAPVKQGEAIGHSVRYLAEKLRRAESIKEKRKREEITDMVENAQRKRVEQGDDSLLAQGIHALKDRAVNVLERQMNKATEQIWKELYGDRWEQGRELETRKLEASQAEWKLQMEMMEEGRRKVKEREHISLKRGGIFLDDVDTRF